MHLPGREHLGKLALAAGGVTAALTTTGAVVFGAQQFREATHHPAQTITYRQDQTDVEKSQEITRQVVGQAKSDMNHLMAGLATYSVLLGAGIGLIAYGSHRTQLEKEHEADAGDNTMEPNNIPEDSTQEPTVPPLSAEAY